MEVQVIVPACLRCGHTPMGISRIDWDTLTVYLRCSLCHTLTSASLKAVSEPATKVYMETTIEHEKYGPLRVVAVANTLVGDWSAYQHYMDKTLLEVAEGGDKILQEQAEELFPEFARRYRWRP